MVTSLYDQFVTDCPLCGGGLVLHQYTLMREGTPRIPNCVIPIYSDGFAVCDDLWGTEFEDGDQSTTDEEVRCMDCHYVGNLEMKD